MAPPDSGRTCFAHNPGGELPFGLKHVPERDTNVAFLMDVARRNPDPTATVRIRTLPGGNNSRTVRSNQPRFRIAHGMFHLDHVIDGNPFGDANNQIETCFHALEDCVCGKRGRNKNNRDRCARLLHGLLNGIENRDVIRKKLAPFARGDTGHDIRSVIKA